jgi:DNA-binding XRE family transcriptional regulator
MTRLTAISSSGSSPIGSNLPAAKPPETSRSVVVYHEFAPPAPEPLKNWKPLQALVDELENDPEMAPLMAEARKEFAQSVYPNEHNSLRALRMLAGLAQIQLAKKSGTAQSHIARIELGQTDPSTDTIVRIAQALNVTPEQVFAAVRIHRALDRA